MKKLTPDVKAKMVSNIIANMDKLAAIEPVTTITEKEFSKMVSEYLPTLNDSDQGEWYFTERGMAERVLERLKNHLFAAEINKEARRKAYLELKAEFDPTLKED